jgi:hypothetical protein
MVATNQGAAYASSVPSLRAKNPKNLGKLDLVSHQPAIPLRNPAEHPTLRVRAPDTQRADFTVSSIRPRRGLRELTEKGSIGGALHVLMKTKEYALRSRQRVGRAQAPTPPEERHTG